MAPTEAESDIDPDDNPILRWRHAKERESEQQPLAVLDEVSAAVATSTSVPIAEAYYIAGDVREAVAETVRRAQDERGISEREAATLLDSFDRILTAWINSPGEIDQEVHEFQQQLHALDE